LAMATGVGHCTEMLRRIVRFMDDLQINLGFWQVIRDALRASGLLGAAGVSAWAASLTTWLSADGPIAYVAAGFGGAVAFLFVLWLVAIFRTQWARALWLNWMANRAMTINTMDATFSNQRINISDFYNPIMKPYFDKTFMDCEIYGPAEVMLTGHTVMSYSDLRFNNFVAVKNDARISNAIIFNNIKVVRCFFYGITFLIPPGLQHEIPPGANWITPLSNGQEPKAEQAQS
jgi:hypothetical protein